MEKKNYFAEIGHFSDSIFGTVYVIFLSETIWMVYRTYCIVQAKLKFFGFFMLKKKIKKSFVWRHGWSNRIHIKIFIKFGSKEVSAQNFRSIEPLIKSEPLGLIWLVNEIQDFRNRINNLKWIYKVSRARLNSRFEKMDSYKNAYLYFHGSGNL